MPELSPWFAGSIRPRRWGWYDVVILVPRITDDYVEVEERRLFRDGTWWRNHTSIPGICVKARQLPVRWRGLAAPATGSVQLPELV